MSKSKNLLLRIGQAFLGTFIASLGIYCLVQSTYGTDALSTLILGIMKHFSVSFGTLSMAFNVLILLIFMLFFKEQRRLVGIGSVINGLLIGVFVNIFTYFHLFNELPSAVKYSFVIIGPIIFGIGTGIYLGAELGMAALELLMTIISKAFKLSIKVSRILMDFLFIFIGFLLGGPVGVGTISVLILLGPVIELTYNKIKKHSPLNI